MEILSSRTLVRPTDPARSQAFYGETLGLAVYRQFGPPDAPGVVYFCGNGLLEVSGHAAPTVQPGHVCLWLQVRDVHTEYDRLVSRGVTGLRPPRTEPWGLIEA